VHGRHPTPPTRSSVPALVSMAVMTVPLPANSPMVTCSAAHHLLASEWSAEPFGAVATPALVVDHESRQREHPVQAVLATSGPASALNHTLC